MANELKPMLAKVMASGGEKKFFFAYGVGKRKDKKGEGELSIGGKKPKKPEIEEALDGCKEFMEGVCWVGKGPDDGGTVYFQAHGKKLSAMVVTKMALTAKQMTGRHHDFQLPSPEEEARAANLKEGDSDEAPAAQADIEAAYQARVKSLTENLKKAITSGNAAGNEAKLKFGESQAFFHKKDFPQALVLLDEVEEQIKKALAGVDNAKKSEPAAQTTAAGDLAAQWTTKLAQWSPAIKAAMIAKGPNAAAIAKLLAQATTLAKPGGDLVRALAELTECHDLATSGVAAPSDPTAEYKAKLAEWSPAIKAAMAAKGPNAATLAHLLTQAASLSKPGGDPVQALAKLTECHDLATESAGTPKPNRAAARPLAPIWDAASENVIDQTTALIIELRKLGEDELDRMADDLLNRVESYLSDLSEVLDECDRATGDERTEVAADAIDFVRQHKSSIAGDGLIKAADTNPLSVKIHLAKTMGSALDEIVGALQA